ncbi:DUF3418 domain-containing protein [Neisseria meningitidis]|uniref:DUF3418 domain-containing protein n=2 Tax=Neisseria meningitidis TaxID=487 RepID=UPI000E5795A9
MQNMKNQIRGSGMDARSNPANVSDGLQNSSGHIGTNTRYRLTKLGEQMARLPIDPKIARILLAAKKHDCMAEILVIASALSIQDPRERPLEARDAAAKAHERFTDKQSDFLAYLNIWDSFQRERDKGLSNKQLVQWCRQYFLSHLRMREWRELHHQLAQTAIEMGLTTKEAAFRRLSEIKQLTSSENQGDQDLSAKRKQKQLDKKQHRAQIRAAKEAGYEQIHRALLTGLIANVGMKSPDGNDYTGARGSRFHLFPASALFKAKPKWVMAAELVETTKLYARDVAVIQPEWIEQEAPHLVRYHYFEPHWEQKRGEVVASERVTLYGLTVLPRRPVSYGKVAPEEAREIFIRSALVAQECDLKADFFVHNKKLIKEITELEHKSRKQDVLVDDEALFAFYNERLPEMAWKDAQGSVWGSEDSVRIIESDKAERSSENERNEFRKNKRNGSRQNENHGNTVGWVENPTSAATAKTVGFDNPTYATQQPTPSPEREGRGEGKTVAAQTNFSATAANPLPQEREQSASASTFSDDLRPANLQQTAPSPVGEGWGEGKTVATQTNFSATSTNPLPQEREQSASASTFSDDLRPANLQQTAPSPVGEGWGEGKTVATQTNFSATSTNPLPQEREQSASASTFSDDLRPANLQQTAPSPVGEGWGEGKTVATQTNFSATTANPLPNPLPQEGEQSAAASAVSNDPQPKKQPAPQKNRLKPLPLADIRTFQAWLKTAERDNPRLLFLSRDDLMQHAAAHITEEQFPKFWQTADGKFKLSYRFEPHHPLDGVTMTVPLTVLNRLHAPSLEWLVPGMIREKIQLQIKALPKQIRRICVPVPEFITQFLSQNPDRNAPILPQLAQAIAKTAGDIRIFEQINQDEWAAFRLPEHCYFNLRIIDDGGQELAGGRKLHELQQQLGQAAAVTFRDNTQEFERDNVTAWDIGTLPESIKFARGKQQLTGYLGLQKEKDGRIALRLFDTTEAAEQAHRQGVIELMKLQLKEQVKDLNKGIQGFTQAAMLLKHINADTLRDDLTQAVCDRAFIGEDELPRNEKAFKEQIKRARSRLPAVKEALSRYLQETAAVYAELNSKLGKHPLTHLLRLRLQTLLAAGFATRTPWAQWPRLPIYLKAMTLRLEKYSSNPARDAAREADIQELEQMWQEKTDSLIKQGLPISDGLAAFKWMIEELRVSLFAQELKTPYPVSVKRLLKEWEKIEK